jgi:hypothetical protein
MVSKDGEGAFLGNVNAHADTRSCKHKLAIGVPPLPARGQAQHLGAPTGVQQVLLHGQAEARRGVHVAERHLKRVALRIRLVAVVQRNLMVYHVVVHFLHVSGYSTTNNPAPHSLHRR